MLHRHHHSTRCDGCRQPVLHARMGQQRVTLNASPVGVLQQSSDRDLVVLDQDEARIADSLRDQGFVAYELHRCGMPIVEAFGGRAGA